jgi:hypothetical protein
MNQTGKEQKLPETTITVELSREWLNPTPERPVPLSGARRQNPLKLPPGTTWAALMFESIRQARAKKASLKPDQAFDILVDGICVSRVWAGSRRQAQERAQMRGLPERCQAVARCPKQYRVPQREEIA